MIELKTKIVDTKDGEGGMVFGYEPIYDRDSETKKLFLLRTDYHIQWDNPMVRIEKQKLFPEEGFWDRFREVEEIKTHYPIDLPRGELLLTPGEASAVEEFIMNGRGEEDA